MNYSKYLIEIKLPRIYKIKPCLNKTIFNKDKGEKETYGEITQKGTDDLVKHFKEYFNENTIFYDLGSGIGKMVLHIGMKYNVKKSIGIELSKERHEQATEIKTKYALKCDNVQFVNTSFFNYDISDATVIYMDNTVFTHEMNEQIFNIIPSNCLLLYKTKLKKSIIPYSKQIINKDIKIERTYFQSQLIYTFKP